MNKTKVEKPEPKMDEEFGKFLKREWPKRKPKSQQIEKGTAP